MMSSSSVDKPPVVVNVGVEEGRGDEKVMMDEDEVIARPSSASSAASSSSSSSSSSTSIAPEDLFEESTLKHMKKTGFLCDLKGLVAKYIVDITRTNEEKCHVIPERADEVILTEIGNYLQWVGMKNSLAVLLSESPIPLNLNGPPTDDEGVPKMVSFFQHFEDLKKVLEEADGSSFLNQTNANEEQEADDKKNRSVNEEVKKNLKEEEKESPSKAGDLSSEEGISDLLSSTVEDLISLKENDTQDISLSDLDAKGMSNCDHAEDLQ